MKPIQSMTKAQAIKELIKLGATNMYSRPRSATVEFNFEGNTGLVVGDARDLLQGISERLARTSK